jgi:hypothetical protein
MQCMSDLSTNQVSMVWNRSVMILLGRDRNTGGAKLQTVPTTEVMYCSRRPFSRDCRNFEIGFA